MISEKRIRERIKKVNEQYKHVLDSSPTSIVVNAPRALMQLEGITILDTLYGVLEEKRPELPYDKRKGL